MHNHSILNVFCILLICAVVIGNCKVKESELVETYCEGSGWVEYRDEKCLKLIKTFATREQAEQICTQESSEAQLVTIKSATDQKYLTEFAFDTSAVEMNVWIGAKRVKNDANAFAWDDGTAVAFANWVVGSPTGIAKRDCVVMQSEYTRGSKVNNFIGKWRDVICGQPNFVICEKLQRWSFSKLRREFLNTREGIQHTLGQVTNELNDARTKLNNTLHQLTSTQNQLVTIQSQLVNTQNGVSQAKSELSLARDVLDATRSELIIAKNELKQTINRINNAENNIQEIDIGLERNMSVPIGFIYVQLPNELTPSKIWPWMNWRDVTAAYAGVFFRVDGGGAADFGDIQEGNTTRLAEVYAGDIDHLKTETAIGINSLPGMKIPKSGWSDGIRTGHGASYYLTYMNFRLSTGEVRPRNMAFRIWKKFA